MFTQTNTDNNAFFLTGCVFSFFDRILMSRQEYGAVLLGVAPMLITYSRYDEQHAHIWPTQSNSPRSSIVTAIASAST